MDYSIDERDSRRSDEPLAHDHCGNTTALANELRAVATGAQRPAVLSDHILSMTTDGGDDSEAALFDAVEMLLTDDAQSIRDTTARALVQVAAKRPSIAASIASALIERLTDDHRSIRHHAVRALSQVAAEYPSTVAPAVPRLMAFVERIPTPTSIAAIETIERVAERCPRDALPAVPRLLTVLAQDSIEAELEDSYADLDWDTTRMLQYEFAESALDDADIRERAANALSETARYCPDELSEYTASISDLVVREQNAYVLESLLGALGSVGESSPDAVVSHLGAIASVMSETTADRTRAKAAWIFATVAESHPTAVADVVPADRRQFVPSLQADDPFVRGTAVSLLAYVAEQRPADVESLLSDIRPLLSDPYVSVRGNAIWVLGYAGTETDRNTLRSVAETDDDMRLRDTAREAIEILEARHGTA